MYILKRIALMIPLLIVISFLAFVLVRVAPGGPFDRERSPASPEIERQLLAKYRLDAPIWKQYFHYLCDAVQGDLGPSMKYRNHTVNDLIAQGLPVTLALGTASFLFAVGLGIPLGVWSAVRRGCWQEHAGSFAAALTVSIPGLVVGPLLIMLFAVKLEWFPVGLWESPWHAVLPTVTLGLYFSGRIARLMREGMVSTLQSEFILAARAKGVREAVVIWKHAFPLAVLPVLSYGGPLLAELLTGSFVVESIFQVPGIGIFMVNSSLSRDYTMVVGLVVLYAVLLLVLNLLVDLAYAWLDPRVTY